MANVMLRYSKVTPQSDQVVAEICFFRKTFIVLRTRYAHSFGTPRGYQKFPRKTAVTAVIITTVRSTRKYTVMVTPSTVVVRLMVRVLKHRRRRRPYRFHNETVLTTAIHTPSHPAVLYAVTLAFRGSDLLFSRTLQQPPSLVRQLFSKCPIYIVCSVPVISVANYFK